MLRKGVIYLNWARIQRLCVRTVPSGEAPCRVYRQSNADIHSLSPMITLLLLNSVNSLQLSRTSVPCCPCEITILCLAVLTYCSQRMREGIGTREY